MASQRPTTEQERKYYISSYLDFAPEIFENVVDSTLDKAINSTVSSLEYYYLKEKKYKHIVIDDPHEAILNEMGDYNDSLHKAELKEIEFALYELKIMYLHKHFEIKLKELSSICFEDWDTEREVFKLDDIVKFYLSKDINLKNFNNYDLVLDLSRVNNSLKHSGKKIGIKIKNIPEFKKVNLLESGHLKAFYLRVKESPKEFIKELAYLIDNRLFPRVKSDFELEFDESTSEFYNDPDNELPF